MPFIGSAGPRPAAGRKEWEEAAEEAEEERRALGGGAHGGPASEGPRRPKKKKRRDAAAPAAFPLAKLARECPQLLERVLASAASFRDVARAARVSRAFAAAVKAARPAFLPRFTGGKVMEPPSGRFFLEVAAGANLLHALAALPAGASVLLRPGLHDVLACAPARRRGAGEGPACGGLVVDKELHLFGRGLADLRAAGLVITAREATVDGLSVEALFDLRSPVERAARRQLVRRGHGGVGEDSDEEEEELKEEEEEGEDSEQEDEEEEEGDEPDLRTPPPRRRRPQIDRPLDRSREPALCKHSAASEPKPPSAVAGITIAAGSRARLQSVQVITCTGCCPATARATDAAAGLFPYGTPRGGGARVGSRSEWGVDGAEDHDHHLEMEGEEEEDSEEGSESSEEDSDDERAGGGYAGEPLRGPGVPRADGVLIRGGARPTLEDVLVYKPDGRGFVLRGRHTSALLLDCEAEGARDSGVYITRGAEALLSECSLSKSRLSGAALAHGGHAVLENTALADNGRYGIAVRDGAGSEPCSVDIAGEGVDLSGNAAGKAMRWPNL